ncbi:hypothetical protein [Pontibacter roseus]|uniref:hypothetical protein n=1 Tax=Pontibacter roseus TaxID=336989 RepID=UPI0003793418|nr:hypothetical protein [Pontibacter roseus]
MRKHNQELEIDEDIELERKNWAVERVAWVFMAIVVLAALLGFTGNGGLKGINLLTAGSQADGVEVEYERYLRRKAPSELKVTLYPTATSPERELQFSKDFYDKVQVEQVVPEPSEVYTHEQGITYTFSGAGSTSPIIFYLKPKHMGSLEVSLKTGEKSLAISQFVYP